MIQVMQRKLYKSRKGFTLIELIVVIAILGILAAIMIPKFAGFQGKANVKAVMSNLRTLETSGSSYAADVNADITTVDSATAAVKTAITNIIGAWPDGSPAGVTYTVVDGIAYADVPAALSWPSTVTDTNADGLFVISELD